MQKIVIWEDIFVDTIFLNESIRKIPPVIDMLQLTRVRFASIECVASLITALKYRIISEIRITESVMTQTHIAYIVHMLSTMQTSKLVIEGQGLTDSICSHLSEFGTSLVYLGLSNNDITNRGMDILADMKLESLDVSRNDISGFVGWKTLFRNCKSIDVSNCFGTPGSLMLACDRMDGVDAHLNDLVLSHNSITSYELTRLLYVLRNVTIHEFHLVGNQLDDESFGCIAQAHNISYIYLDNNPRFTDKGIIRRQGIYKKNSNIRHISVMGCGLSSETMDVMMHLNDEHRRCVQKFRCELERWISIPDIIEEAVRWV